MAQQRALVTGGAGFIGSHVADHLLGAGYRVAVVDDLSSGRRELVPEGASFFEVDITDGVSFGAVCASFGPTLICHLAAQASVTYSVRFPQRDLAVNVGGTLTVLEAARRLEARVVFASTGGALYGEQAPLPTPEEFAPAPLSPYGAAKLAGEAYLLTYSRLYGQPHTVLRLANVYGPRQNPHGEAGVVAIFSEHLAAGRPPKIFGSGTQTRDYVYVEDVAGAFLAAAEGPGGVYNIGTGRQTSVVDLYAKLAAVAGSALEPHFAPPRPGELAKSALHCGLVARRLGWRPKTELAEGLARTYRSYAGQP